MTKKLMFVAVVLLVGVLGFALDAGITAAILSFTPQSAP